MNLVNGPSLTEHAMQNSDLEKRMMREIELICAVAELECLQEGKSLNNDQLNLRIGDILAPIDEELEFSFLGIIDVESATCDAAKTLADTLSAAPRGTYVILRSMGGGYDGIPHRLGYDGWMADGKGNLASHSGHKFITQSPEAFCLSPRSLYSQIWSAISYNMRNCVRDEISSATAQANAERFLGKKISHSNYIRGTEWSTITLEEILPDENRYMIKVTKRGASRRFKIDDTALRNSLPIVATMPAQYQDAGNSERKLSLPERRIAACKAAWNQYGEQNGIIANAPLYDESFKADGDRYSYQLKQTISYNPYTAEEVGTFSVNFVAGSDEVATVNLASPQIGEAA